MNTPSQTLICNPEIEWSEPLCISFRPFRVSSHLPCLCEYVHLIVKKCRLSCRMGEKRKKTHTQLPGFGLALLRQLLALRAGNLTKQLNWNKIHVQDPFHPWMLCHDHVSHRLKKKTLLTRLQIQMYVKRNCIVACWNADHADCRLCRLSVFFFYFTLILL